MAYLSCFCGGLVGKSPLARITLARINFIDCHVRRSFNFEENPTSSRDFDSSSFLGHGAFRVSDSAHAQRKGRSWTYGTSIGEYVQSLPYLCSKESKSMATTALFTGLDSYRLTGVRVTDRELGHGSYATVLELEYMGLKCAGKKIHELLLRQGDTSYTVQRFGEECRLLSQLRHPNIVQFLGIHFQQGVQAPILVMEFLPTNVTSCIDQYGILPKEITYSILYDVALGLFYLHN